MKAAYLAGTTLNDLLAADHACWKTAAPVRLGLSPTPLAMQPTDAIRAQWQGRPYGIIDELTIAAVHNGEELAFRLQWRDATDNREIRDNDRFVDAAAIMLPSVKLAPIMLMGARGAPVNALYWRADDGGTARNIIAEGYGTSRSVEKGSVTCSHHHADGLWTIVLARRLGLRSSEPVAQLRPGSRTPYGVAIWEGGNRERAGIKSFALAGDDLVLARAR